MKWMIVAGILLYTGPVQSQKITVPLRFDHYYTYDQINEALDALHKAYPDLTRKEKVGYSDEGRTIWSLTVHNPKIGSENDKPAIYVDGNIHGNEIQASEVCLYFLNYILTEYGKIDKVTDMVDRSVVYCVPSVNVDGRYHWFEDPGTSSSNRGLRIPKDDDNDGLIDEDPVDDLNGDGHITQMRKKDPFGEYILDPLDPRIMIRVEDDQPGTYTLLGSEGLDNDGDGRINEDDYGYVDPNRNWGYNWQPNYFQRGGGSYPHEGTGIQALAEYLMERDNIIMAWAFHNSGGMFLRGPTSKQAREYDRKDLEVFDYLGYHAEKMVPGYRYLISWKDLYTTWGDFGDFTDDVVGAFTFVGELFQSNTESYRLDTTRPAGEKDRQSEGFKFNDYLTNGQMFIDWKTYQHPLYGEVEIGGWTKFTRRLPQPFMLMDLVHRNAMAIFHSAWHLPQIEMEVFEKEKIGKDLYRIKIRLENKKAVSSMTMQSVRNNIHRKDFLRLSGKRIQVVSGGPLTDPYRHLASYKKDKPEIQFFQIPGFGKVEFQFLISGKGDLKLEYNSIKATDLEKIITL